uniref:NADH-ubiquinone oxidoreductase chain 4 n=2 Tax=Schistosoma japonicum TaxID=6182 RepID=A0A0D5WAN2_SCHJA|nr:NADH dehydrogenase subunit 4 [Schistosoma japonicum]ALV84558.1 NADH dehydrogenase subunit 4 [Schistosoma japonicum]ALV84726.1 NADH dehydrogenase subunit 4 [Schistosoma japonicum]ALV84774.1 NADH dehydrogenase subunit 4 [Schistosoma japonicum]ALV84798.1 NADH dehydrogenase subunit 4 [Schistosoma japonicum]
MSRFTSCFSSFITGFVVTFIFLLIFYSSIWVSDSSMVMVGVKYYLCDGLVIIDTLSCLMIFLTSIIWLVLWLVGSKDIVLFISVFSAMITYVVSNSLVFWFFYELSIISALYMLIVGSPYPERYISSWYFGGYILLSSVPLLLGICFIGLNSGSFNVILWDKGDMCDSYGAFLLIIVMFLTKIPVFPFHGWLPLVHAEASSPVSIILSGYIMKLGLVGLVRLCGWLLIDYIYYFSTFLLCYSVVYLVAAVFECDSKRWLAYLSLSHILIGVCILLTSTYCGDYLAFIYCLGHGLSVALLFMVIWFGYEISGSRNWGILVKIFGGGLIMHFIMGFVFLNVCGFPPALQFFGELWLVINYITLGDIISLLLVSIYIFSGSIIGFIIYGLVICSPINTSYEYSGGLDNFLFCIMYLSLLNLILFIVL